MTCFRASSSSFFFSPGGDGGQRSAKPKSLLSRWAVPGAPVSWHLIGCVYFQQTASTTAWLTGGKKEKINKYKKYLNGIQLEVGKLEWFECL